MQKPGELTDGIRPAVKARQDATRVKTGVKTGGQRGNKGALSDAEELQLSKKMPPPLGLFVESGTVGTCFQPRGGSGILRLGADYAQHNLSHRRLWATLFVEWSAATAPHEAFLHHHGNVNFFQRNSRHRSASLPSELKYLNFASANFDF